MAGVIIFDPDDELTGFVTGDTLAVGTHLDIETDTLYFTDGVNIYAWAANQFGYLQEYTWKSGEIRLPNPVNMGAAIVEAEAYTGTAAGDSFFDDVIYLAKWEGGDGQTSYTELAQSDTHLFYGDAQIDTAQFNFGASSLLFDGTTDGVQTVGDTIYQFASTDDLTVDGFVRFAALPTASNQMQLVNQASTDTRLFEVHLYNNAGTYQLRGTIGFATDTAGNITTPTLGEWYHFALQRRYNGGAPIVDLFFDGTRVATASNSGTPSTATNQPITLGAWDNAVTQIFTEVLNGHLDDVRITKAARYGDVATITVPTEDYPENVEANYDITFKLYADDVLKHTQVVTSDEPFRLPGGYLSNIYSVEIVSALPVTRVSVAENIFELAEG